MALLGVVLGGVIGGLMSSLDLGTLEVKKSSLLEFLLRLWYLRNTTGHLIAGRGRIYRRLARLNEEAWYDYRLSGEAKEGSSALNLPYILLQTSRFNRFIGTVCLGILTIGLYIIFCSENFLEYSTEDTKEALLLGV